jgi:endonuclease YncB( thermonuclease family)
MKPPGASRMKAASAAGSRRSRIARHLGSAVLLAIASLLSLTGCDAVGAAGQRDSGHRDTTAHAGARFSCTPAKVWDGDTFTCSDGTKVRVAGINAREVRWTGKTMVDQGCKRNAPCPTTSGLAAREYLARLFGGGRGVGPNGHILVAGPKLECQPNGKSHDRSAGWCSSSRGGDLSCAMVRGGYAMKWPRYWNGHRC